MDTQVAIVRFGVDPMNAMVLEQSLHHRPERLGGEAAALVVRRQRDSHLGRSGLSGYDPHGAIAAERSGGPIDRGQLHPLSRLAEHKSLLSHDVARPS
jgi:hypothetical protein